MVMVTMVHILCQTYHGEEMLEPKKGAHVPRMRLLIKILVQSNRFKHLNI